MSDIHLTDSQTKGFPSRGNTDYLTPEENAFVQRILGQPQSFPQAFWTAIMQKVALDGEPIPYTQVQGLSRFAFGNDVTLPASPSNGQLFSLSLDGGFVWNFRYNAQSSSSYKWEFVGGPPLIAEVAASESTTAGYVDLTTDGPSVDIPLDGEYICYFGAFFVSSSPTTVGGNIRVYNSTSSTQVAAMGDFLNAVGEPNPYYRTTSITATAGTHKLQYKISFNPGTSTFSLRTIHVTPIRVS